MSAEEIQAYVAEITQKLHLELMHLREVMKSEGEDKDDYRENN